MATAATTANYPGEALATTMLTFGSEGMWVVPLVFYCWLFLRVRIGSQIQGTNTERNQKWGEFAQVP